MGTSTSAAQVGRKLGQLQSAVPKANRDVVKTSGTLVQNFINANIRSVAGGDNVLSNAGRVEVPDPTFVGQTSVMVRAVGPVHWLERGVDPHPIVPGGRRGLGRKLLGYNLTGGAFGPSLPASSLFRKGGYARSTKGAGVVLKFADGRFSRYADDAGGFKAAKVWSRGVDSAKPPIKSVFRGKHVGTLQQIFG